ncbi:MAG TPA: hypothetical protein VFT16_00205 [Candidatus Saccharimonadales bacterium]|nr:hypothetical protein [Candidatus Saccharimonadales bacterium]
MANDPIAVRMSNILADKKIILKPEEIKAIAPIGAKHTKPSISTVYVGYADPQTKKRVYYLATISNGEESSAKPLYLSLFFGNPFTTDIAKALAGRGKCQPCVTTGPFRVAELNPSMPIVGCEFDAPAVLDGTKLLLLGPEGWLPQEGNTQNVLVGTAVLWRARCDDRRYGGGATGDEKAEICDRRLFTVAISS